MGIYHGSSSWVVRGVFSEPISLRMETRPVTRFYFEEVGKLVKKKMLNKYDK